MSSDQPPGGGRGLAGSAAVMFAGTLTSRILGLVRSALLIAAIYTLGGAADAFAVANKLPNIIYMLLAGGVLNAVLVPQIVRAMRTDDGGQEYVNRLLTLAGTALAAVTVILTAAAPILVTMYAAEFRSGPWASVAVAFAMWCLPQLFFYGMYTLLGQVLNARSIFGPYMWAPAVNNLFAIVGLVTYLVIFGSFDPDNPDPASAFTAGRVALLAGSATLGVVAQAAVLVVPLVRSGFRFRFRWGLRGSGLGRAGRVAWWAFLALLAGQVGYLALSNLAAAASTEAEQTGVYAAGNAAWDAAFLVFMLPQSLITVSLVTAIFTRLSTHAAAGRSGQVRDDLSMGLRTLGVFTVFAAGALAVLAVPVVQAVQFDVATFEAYRAVGAVLVAMVLGLPAIAIWTMTQRVYFAYEDTRALFFIQIPMALIQIVGCVLVYLVLPAHWWVVGSAVANSASLMFGALVSFLALRRKLYRLDGARILRTYLRLTLALIIPVGIGWGLLHLWGVQTNLVGALARVLLLGGLMALVYFICLRRLRVDELDELLVRVGAMAEPLTRRLAPAVARIPGLPQMRTIWDRITGTDHRRATPMDLPPAFHAGDVLAGRYRLTGQDQHNGHWRGTDTILDKDVQITTVSGEHREAALDAARRAALVTDDRLLRILRVGVHDGVGFIITEEHHGQSLAQLLSFGPLHPDQARTLIGEAAGALEVARRRGVHHLHLGPENLYRTHSGHVVVTGLAVDAAAAGITPTSAREAARTDTVDLVGLLYSALTAQYPGPPERAGHLPAAPEYRDQPVPPAELVPDIPYDLDTLCAVTFGPHRDGPFTPGELVRDLEPWTEPGQGPVHADAATTATAPAAADPVPHQIAADDDTHQGARVAGAGVLPAGGAEPAADAPPPPAAEHPPEPVDTSGWAPQAPPPDKPLPTFESILRPGVPGPPAQVLDTYAARHERPTFDPALTVPTSAAAPDQTQGQPDTAPPPTPGQAPSARAAAATTGAAAGAAPAAASGTASGAGGAGAAGLGAGGATAGAALSGAAASTGRALRSFRTRAGEMSRRAAQATRELTSSWSSGSDPDPGPDTDEAATGTWPAPAPMAEDGTGTQFAEYVAHPTAATAVDPNEEIDEPELEPEEMWEEDDPERFNPTPVVILTMIALVVVAGLLAIGTLRDARTSFDPDEATGPTPTVAPVEEPEETEEPEQSAEPEPEEAEEDEEGPDPVVDSVRSLDDNPDLAYLAIDGNSDTIWRSLRYNDPRYGMKDGLGFVIELEEVAVVTSVTLDVQGNGGTVQIRADDPDNPDSGPVLAEGAMGPEVTYELSEPTETDVLVLWFPELPVADSDGRNRIELAEITVG